MVESRVGDKNIASGTAELPTRGMVRQWLRSLRVLTDAGEQPLDQRLELIAQIGGAGTPTVAVCDEAEVDDVDRLLRAVRTTNDLRGREHGAHALVTALLLHWLSEATGRTEADIITELERAVDGMVRPDEEVSSAEAC